MPEVSKKYSEELPRLKEAVENWYNYFKDNFDTFHKTRSFVFRSTLTADDISILESLKRPQLEFNILEAYVSRLRGEFSKQEPSLEVSSMEGTQVDPNTVKVVEDHIRSIMFAADKNSTQYQVYTDILTGGFSAIKFWTEYRNEMAFEQDICWDRTYDPTLTVFDPMARQPHKGDGNHCAELFPMRKKDFEREHPGINLKELQFTSQSGQFRWAYNNNKEDILLVCDFYEKKKTKKKIVYLANGKTLLKDDYAKYLEQWNANGHIAQPAIVVRERWSNIETIMRYRFISTQLISVEETDYKILPIIFVDGNSLLLRDASGSAVTQFCRPYVFNAIGTQKLKNYAGQTLANELENMVQHKFIIAKEAIPMDYVDAYKKPQVPSLIVFNAYHNEDPNKQLPPPREVQRPPIPQEITQTFMLTDQLSQTILGSYDAALGINNNELSGVAIVEGASQSNATAMPYIVGFLQAMTQLGQGLVDLIPKYYVTPRSIPVLGLDRKHMSIPINSPGAPNMQYGSNVLNVKVEAGVNFAIQKSRTLQQITVLSQASPAFANFINSVGLPVIVDNMEGRGIDQLKAAIPGYLQQQQQQQQQAAQQPNPLMMKNQLDQQRLQQQAVQDHAENQFRAAETINKTKQIQNEQQNMQLKAFQAHAEHAVQLKKADAEIYGKSTDLALKEADMNHRHDLEADAQFHDQAHDRAQLAHDILLGQQQNQSKEPTQ